MTAGPKGATTQVTPDRPEGTDAVLIGKPGGPVRAFAFAGGAFDTAMQLGVAHALLVIRGESPDAIVGLSAGAVNAVAVAEVLQAGKAPEDIPTWAALSLEERTSHRLRQRDERIARFREILNEYRQTPRSIISALLPDAYQVEAEQPLQPVALPIHNRHERRDRQRAVSSRAGLVNLFNSLLRIRLTIGTVTRAARRVFGWRATSEIRSGPARLIARCIESVRTWNLIGAHLHLLAPILPALVSSLVRPRSGRGTGGTAASLIFRPQRLMTAVAATQAALALACTIAFWLVISLSALSLVVAPLKALTEQLRWPVPLGVYLAGVGVVILIAARSRLWKEVSAFNRTTGRQTATELWLSLSLMVSLTIGWLLPVVALQVILTMKGPTKTLSWDSLLGALNDAATRVGNVWWGSVYAFSVVAVGIIVIISLVIRWPRSRSGRVLQVMGQRLLARFDLSNSLLDPHPLREFFVRNFDREYYGRRNMDLILRRALDDDLSPTRTEPTQKLIGDYHSVRHPRIHLGLAVADVQTGQIRVVPETHRVVAGLMASTALVPFFPPVVLGGRTFIDGTNVSSEPVGALIDLLTERVNPASTAVQIYSVSRLPVSDGELPGGKAKYLSVVEVVPRAMQLQRLRDATLERRLTHLYTRTIPVSAGAAPRVGGKTYLRAWLTPVEPDAPLEVTRRYLEAPSEADKHRVIEETIADGCRAAMQVMVRPSIRAGTTEPEPGKGKRIRCDLAVNRHIAGQIPNPAVVRPDLLVPFPGVKAGEDPGTAGPGLEEVCRHCALNRSEPGTARTLRLRDWAHEGPAWPVEGVPPSVPPGGKVEDLHFSAEKTEYEKATHESLLKFAKAVDARTVTWPSSRAPTGLPDQTRPLVSLLFSGGVFRGVYQMGVLNALNEIGLKPDIVAGASVGSITAAMVSEVFTRTDRAARLNAIGRLAATFMALDRLVVTDQFADFIRSVTLRAAATRFSIRQADRFFRRYDYNSANQISQDARLVTAGIERLFYVSPYELNDLVRALRLGKSDQVSSLLENFAEEWLRRTGVGDQVLGAAPLELLIRENVRGGSGARDGCDPLFNSHLEDGIYFLATATNLGQGRLEILGEQQWGSKSREASLYQGLLASSAFPGVFRPRWSWEVMPAATVEEQYIDGGVMDNLPLDAVAQFLNEAATNHLTPRRPTEAGQGVPHLLFSASLEAETLEPDSQTLAWYRKYWPGLLKRAGQLGYNRKLEMYQEAQRAVRRLIQAYPDRSGHAPLDLEVVMVRPKWLCGTFAFHPMLGFRRERQAASIAHGCATTLLEFGRLAQTEPTASWLRAWRVDPHLLPPDPPAHHALPIHTAPTAPGDCWCRPGIPCPFSRPSLEGTDLPGRVKEELTQIYQFCKQDVTHRSQEAHHG